MRRWRALVAFVMAVAAVALVVTRARGQAPESAFVVGGVKAVAEPRLAGLQWRFVRTKYHYELPRRPPLQDAGTWRAVVHRRPGRRAEPVAPRQDRDLASRSTIRSCWRSTIRGCSKYPWIYFVEPGNLELHRQRTSPILREFLLRGGTATFDDFHGPFEWDNFGDELKRVFPDRADRRSAEGLIRSSAASTSSTATRRSPGSGRSWGPHWEKGGFVPHLRDDPRRPGRPMVFINWNTDMGDGWEWSNAEEYPGYVKYTAHGLPDGDQRNRLLADALSGHLRA